METTLSWPQNFGGIVGDKRAGGKKVIFCCPTISKPYPAFLASLEASIPLIHEAGWDEGAVYQVGCPYISAARAMMLWKALRADADVIVFLDHDLSWKSKDLLTLIETEGDVVAGTYRYKTEPEEYMGGLLPDIHGRPQVRADGCVKAFCAPAGFLKVTRNAVKRFMRAHPELCFGDPIEPHIDLFNHGAHEGTWYGEDYAFCRNWTLLGGELWIIPDLNITHHTTTDFYIGNFHQFLLRCDGGSESANPRPIAP